MSENRAFNIPILLITFNRPNHTRKVFEEIKKQQPKQLFVFQDGARNGNSIDTEKCKSVRAIFDESLNWECDLKTFYSGVNLGCGLGPTNAISWFFENVDYGIIIEDDAVPAQDFFQYAEELLIRYKTVDNVKAIGSMHIDKKKYGASSYYFSMMNRNLCVWATWRRVWQDFDYYMNDVSVTQVKKSLKYYHASGKEISYWLDRFNEIKENRLNESSWDMQFLFSIWLKNGIGVCSNVNLSTNIGFDNEGTHTFDSKNPVANLQVGKIMPLIHPDTIKLQRKADLNYHKIYFQPYEYGIQGAIRSVYKLNRKIKLFLGKKGSWIKNKK